MINPWVAMGAVLAVLAALVGALKLLERVAHPHPEVVRKLLHVAMGLVVVTFPWVFDARWPVVVLAATAGGLLTVLRYMPRMRGGLGSVIHGVERPSLGEICFPAAVGVLFVLARGDWLVYVVPMLILTLADALAALIGLAYGRVRYVTSEGLKSAEGSIIFFAVAFMSVHVPLLLFTDVGRAQTLLIATIVGLLSMLVEAVAIKGLDNLLIPIAAYAMLRWYMGATVEALALRLVVTVALLVFAMIWRRRTSLDDSALMASALYGYGAWILGGWECVIGPALLFLVHVGLWPRLTARRGDSVWAVLSVVSGGLLWLVVFRDDSQPWWRVGYATVFGAHLAIIGVSRIAGSRSQVGDGLCALLSIAGGIVLACVQLVPAIAGAVIGREFPIAWAGCAVGVVLAAWLFYGLMPWLYGPRGSDGAIHTAGALAAIAGSAAAVLLLLIGG